MDPNEALKQIRQLVTSILNKDYDYDMVVELAETFCGLDEWISKGGFKPKEWNG